eukprot:gene12860-14185_t
MAEKANDNNYWLLEWEEPAANNSSDEDSSNASGRKNGNKNESSDDGSSDGSSDSSELEEGSTCTESSEEEDDSSDSSVDDANHFAPGTVQGTLETSIVGSNIVGGDIVAEEIIGDVQGRQPFEEIIGEEVVGDTGHDETAGNDSELLIAIAGDRQPASDRRQNANCVVQYMEAGGYVDGAEMDVNDVAGEEIVVRKKASKKKKKNQSREQGRPKGKLTTDKKGGQKRLHECPICDKTFSSREAIRTHMKLHSDPDLFRCKLCDKDFKFKQSLQRHMSHHTGEFPFYCRICGKGFVKGARCRDHERVHLKELDKSGHDKPSSKPRDSSKSERKAMKEVKGIHLDDDMDEMDDVDDDFVDHADENPWAQSDSDSSPPKKPDDLQIGAYEEIEAGSSKNSKNLDRKRKRKSKSPLKLKIKIGQ